MLWLTKTIAIAIATVGQKRSAAIVTMTKTDEIQSGGVFIIRPSGVPSGTRSCDLPEDCALNALSET